MLETWKQQRGMLGVRLTFHHAWDRPWLTDGTADWFWPAAERLGIPVMLNVPTLQPEIGRIAEQHPRLRLIIDHMGRLKGFKGRRARAPHRGDDRARQATPMSSSSCRCCRPARRIPIRTGIYILCAAAGRGVRAAAHILGTDLSAMLSARPAPIGRRLRCFRGMPFLSARILNGSWGGALPNACRGRRHEVERAIGRPQGPKCRVDG